MAEHREVRPKRFRQGKHLLAERFAVVETEKADVRVCSPAIAPEIQHAKSNSEIVIWLIRDDVARLEVG
jgi:hypothetical protein